MQFVKETWALSREGITERQTFLSMCCRIWTSPAGLPLAQSLLYSVLTSTCKSKEKKNYQSIINCSYRTTEKILCITQLIWNMPSRRLHELLPQYQPTIKENSLSKVFLVFRGFSCLNVIIYPTLDSLCTHDFPSIFSFLDLSFIL